jgi:SAM-dependent methyltransferase
MEEFNYKELNRESWNRRTEVHYDSEFYDNENFIQGKNSLNEIELQLLGDVSGKRILHLQCHFGQDTISLARMGAKAVGVDLSDAAIDKARKLAEITKANAEFVCCDIYDLPNHLNSLFDIVFTSYGTIGWLPDLDKWAGVINHFLKPGGQFLIVEFHPVVWMFDDDFEKVGYNYFNAEPIVESETGTYADRSAELNSKFVSWNHDLAEVMTSIMGVGLSIEQFKEYDYSPYDCFAHTEKIDERKFRIKHLGNKIPMVYALMARKKGDD